jgi:hypothetical protein
VIVPVTADGFGLYADLGAGGSAHVVADVTGYMTSESAPSSSSGRFVAVRPARAFDSRNGGILADDDTVAISAGASGVEIPPSTSGVVWNLTATETVRYGFAKVWAAGSAEPPTSALNWSTASMTVANGSIIRPDQHGVVIARLTDESSATAGPMAHLLADVFGYFT